MPVARAGFEHAHADVRIRAQPVGEHAARRPGADDHVIESVHFDYLRMSFSQNRFPLLRDMRYSAAATAVGSV